MPAAIVVAEPLGGSADHLVVDGWKAFKSSEQLFNSAGHRLDVR